MKREEVKSYICFGIIAIVIFGGLALLYFGSPQTVFHASIIPNERNLTVEEVLTDRGISLVKNHPASKRVYPIFIVSDKPLNEVLVDDFVYRDTKADFFIRFTRDVALVARK